MKIHSHELRGFRTRLLVTPADLGDTYHLTEFAFGIPDLKRLKTMGRGRGGSEWASEGIRARLKPIPILKHALK